MSESAGWKDYIELCKPRVVALMIVTAIVGMCLATPHWVSWKVFLFGNLGIALAAGSAAAVNHIVDRNIDKVMQRTKRRPIVQGKIKPRNAIIFAVVLCALAMFLLVHFVNTLTAYLTFLTLIGYAVVYTSFLKYATPQNIVIGGAAGAAPPMLGWVAVTGHLDPGALILMLIIFVWTPPHFWALAIHRVEDYAKANVPMLPNKYGIPFTKLSILLYTILLVAVTWLPYAIGISGWLYLAGSALFNIYFLYLVIRLMRSDNARLPFKIFWYSIWYLFGLFIFLLLDHYLPIGLVVAQI